MPPLPSAGVLLYRMHDDHLEVLIAHPGGPFWATRHEGAWSIPKGELDDGEDPAKAARREFLEETAHQAPQTLLDLGTVKQRSGKIVYGYAGAGDLDPAAITCNEISIEWPPRSGAMITIPEIDEVRWCGLTEARLLLNQAQIPFVDRLCAALGVAGLNPGSGTLPDTD